MNIELLQRSSKTLGVLFDGESKNVNSLQEMPKSKMKLYGFSAAYKGVFFDTVCGAFDASC